MNVVQYLDKTSLICIYVGYSVRLCRKFSGERFTLVLIRLEKVEKYHGMIYQEYLHLHPSLYVLIVLLNVDFVFFFDESQNQTVKVLT